METGLLYSGETHQILGACFEVYREKGCGFLEAVYQECLEVEFGLRGVPFVAQRSLGLDYKGKGLRAKYTPDLICYDRIIVELKAQAHLIDENRAQIQNYLRAARLKLGLLVNFGHYPKVEFERVIAEKGRYSSQG